MKWYLINIFELKKSVFVKNPSPHFTSKILVNQDLEPMFGKSSLFP